MKYIYQSILNPKIFQTYGGYSYGINEEFIVNQKKIDNLNSFISLQLSLTIEVSAFLKNLNRNERKKFKKKSWLIKKKNFAENIREMRETGNRMRVRQNSLHCLNSFYPFNSSQLNFNFSPNFCPSTNLCVSKKNFFQ